MYFMLNTNILALGLSSEADNLLYNLLHNLHALHIITVVATLFDQLEESRINIFIDPVIL